MTLKPNPWWMRYGQLPFYTVGTLMLAFGLESVYTGHAVSSFLFGIQAGAYYAGAVGFAYWMMMNAREVDQMKRNIAELKGLQSQAERLRVLGTEIGKEMTIRITLLHALDDKNKDVRIDVPDTPPPTPPDEDKED